MCGILGIYGSGEVLEDMYVGLMKMQHRGQDAAGIAVYTDGILHLEKDTCLVQDLFSKYTFPQGEMALGHVRYGTSGTSLRLDSQPFYTSSPFGLAICHNGNITNNEELRKMLLQGENPRRVNSNSDSETLLEVLARELQIKQKTLGSDFPGVLFAAIEGLMKTVKGSYSVLGIIIDVGFFAFRDPFGIKPLLFGKRIDMKGPCYAFASESVALDALGYAIVDDLKPGEAVFMDRNRTIHRTVLMKEDHHPCIFEYIYFASPVSYIDGISVSGVRHNLGRLLGKAWRKTGKQADVVTVVPSSATNAALGIAEELGIPFEVGIKKNPYIGRSFIESTAERRSLAVRLKLDIDRRTMEGKRVIVVDDSIVRGTTSKMLIRRLRETGCKEIFFVSSAPPIKWPCVYGIDMSIKKELISANNTHDDVCRYLEADFLLFQTLEDLREASPLKQYCDACFTGNYPTELSAEKLREIERGRIESKMLLQR